METRLRELSDRLSGMGDPAPPVTEPVTIGMSLEMRLRALERDTEDDRQRLRSAQAQLATLQAQLLSALAPAGAGLAGERAAGTSALFAGADTVGVAEADELAVALRLELQRERRLRGESDERLGFDLANDLAALGIHIGTHNGREGQGHYT